MSLCLCTARADMCEPLADVSDERIAVAASKGAGALTTPTHERWFGMPFLGAIPELAETLIVGAKDAPLPDEMNKLQDLIPNAEFELIEAAGHLANIDRPEGFNAALLRHFRDVSNHQSQNQTSTITKRISHGSASQNRTTRQTAAHYA